MIDSSDASEFLKSLENEYDQSIQDDQEEIKKKGRRDDMSPQNKKNKKKQRQSDQDESLLSSHLVLNEAFIAVSGLI